VSNTTQTIFVFLFCFVFLGGRERVRVVRAISLATAVLLDMCVHFVVRGPLSIYVHVCVYICIFFFFKSKIRISQ
jgi:hypothetical protein